MWEVAGVFTEPDLRRQGLASQVVVAAIEQLVGLGATPRYQVDVTNIPSMELARSIALEEFARMEHLLIADTSGASRHRTHASQS